MANAINILFAVPNFRDVLQAFSSVNAGLDRIARSGQAAYDRHAKAADKSFRDAAKSAERGAAEIAKAEERSAKAATKAVEREAREAVRIKNSINKLEIKDWSDKEREKSRLAKTEERSRLNEAKRAAADVKREHERVVREQETRAKRFGGMVGGSVGRVAGLAGRAAGLAATLGGGFTIADSLQRGIREEATAGVIFRGAANKGGFSGQKEVQELATNTAIATGGTTEDILAGLDQFVRKTGDLGAAKKILEDMAKLSAATGTNFADMGATAAEVQNQLGDSAQTMEVMRALAGQGRAGAIDIKDLGQYGGRLAAGAAQFQGDMAGNIESFGAIAQLAKKLGGATGPAEATESVARLASDFTMHQQGFRDAGVEVYADKGRTKFRAAEDILTEIVSKTKGDLSKLDPLFGEMSMRAARGAQVAYTAAGGGAAGEAAIREQFSTLRSSTLSKADVDEGVRGRLTENDAKVNQAMEELHRTINHRLLPMLPGLIEKFTQLIPTIGKVIDFLVSNPWQGIGLLVGGAIVKDIATAGLGNLVGAAVTEVAKRALVGGAASSAATSAVAGGATAAEGAALGAAGTGTAAAGTGVLGAAGAALAGVGAAVGIGGAAVYGLGKLSQKRGEGRFSEMMAMDESTPEARQKKLESLQAMVGRVGAQEAAAQKLRSGAHTDQITPAEAKALGDTDAAAASKSMAQMNAVLEQLNQNLRQMNERAKEMAAIEMPIPSGPADPNHPSRGALAP